ncbi:cytochrome c3 family protein [Candidatus Pyrohabitans sp.]
MTSRVTGIIIAVLAVALVGTLIYMGNVSSTYSEQLQKKEKQIASLEAELNKLKAELIAAEEEKPTTGEAQTTAAAPQINCADCHGDVSGFHEIGTLMKVDQEKGIEPPRICTTCHGDKIHKIHERKIEEKGVQMCQTCHMTKEGEFRVPEKRPDDVLVCQLCHFDGNYIKIHKGKCERCHYGKPNEIHQPVLQKRYEEIASL